METVDIRLEKIFLDQEFNCREHIAPADVLDLAKSIQEQGLLQPIVVQPIDDVKDYHPDHVEYRIIAGHRRYVAFKALSKDPQFQQIPCVIRTGLDKKEALIFNLMENTSRKDLNILEEAKALEGLKEAGVPRETVASRIGKSGGWVQVRFMLLDLPETIQQEAAAGILNQYELKKIWSIKSDQGRLEATKQVKEAKQKGEKGTIDKITKRKQAQATNVKKTRTPTECFDMIEVMGKSGVKYGLHTRALAWAAGEITTDEIFDDIKKQDPEFLPPMEF